MKPLSRFYANKTITIFPLMSKNGRNFAAIQKILEIVYLFHDIRVSLSADRMCATTYDTKLTPKLPQLARVSTAGRCTPGAIIRTLTKRYICSKTYAMGKMSLSLFPNSPGYFRLSRPTNVVYLSLPY
jgi:hypothetical protein